MPQDSICGSCGLVFSVGWFHGRSDDDFAPSYCYLTCVECGIVHLVQFSRTQKARRAVFNKGSEATEAPDKLSAQSGPVLAESWDPSFGTVDAILGEWLDVGQIPGLRMSRKVPKFADLEGSADPLDLDQLSCSGCGLKGTLTSEWPSAFRQCPHCGEKELEHRGWIS